MTAPPDPALFDEILDVLVAKGLVRPSDKAAARRRRAVAQGVERVRDRRRFRQNAVPDGTASVTVAADAEGTIFPTRVAEPTSAHRVLKDGTANAKIGGDVLVGWLRGARIFTLTLEERATCPRSCEHWRTCYGNAMPHPLRWRHGEALLQRIEAELAEATAAHRLVLVRLHVLGDFWSVAYVDFWRRMLERHGNLYLFGFTAWPPGTPIGDAVQRLRDWPRARAWLRHSGRSGEWGCFTVDFPTGRTRLGDAVVCPEQRDAMEGSPRGMHCGACGLCWKVSAPIVFVEH
jgi:hypothetical protein